jgi:hypothetical protein
MKSLILTTFSLVCLIAQAQFPTNGLVAYFPFSGNAKDSSVNKTHGTTNNVTLTTDRFGKANSAYLFNGSNSYIQFPSTNVQNSRYTFSLWAYLTSMPADGDYTFVLNVGSSGGDQNLNTANNYAGTVDGWVSSSYNTASATYGTNEKKSHTLNTWQHVLAVRDSNFLLLYVNGVKVDSMGSNDNRTPYYGSGTVKAMIGSRQDLSRPFEGKIDEVCIYNRALSKQEVEQLYSHQMTSSIVRLTSAQQNISLYPNVGTPTFNIGLSALKTTSGQVIVKISNMLGQVVYEQSYPNDGGVLEINSGLSAGQYVVTLYDGQKAYIGSEKLLIQE